MIFITEIEKSTLKFIWKHKRLWIAKAILSKKSNTEGITIPDFKLFYRAIETNTAWYWHKNGYEDHWNRRPRYESTQLSPLDFWQMHSNIQWRKNSLFNKCCWEN
jgi:hypothetical protein